VPGRLERVEEPLFPLDALREALVNAVCHRDYRSTTIGGRSGVVGRYPREYVSTISSEIICQIQGILSSRRCSFVVGLSRHGGGARSGSWSCASPLAGQNPSTWSRMSRSVCGSTRVTTSLRCGCHTI
jgi:hypothetical protein